MLDFLFWGTYIYSCYHFSILRSHRNYMYWSIFLIKSSAPGRCNYNLKLVIFKLISKIDILSISCEDAFKWIPFSEWFKRPFSDSWHQGPPNNWFKIRNLNLILGIRSTISWEKVFQFGDSNHSRQAWSSCYSYQWKLPQRSSNVLCWAVIACMHQWRYHKISKTHQIPKFKCFSSRLTYVFAQSNEARCYVENEDVVGAAPTGDAPTTSEWSTILLPTKVLLILETWR